MVHVFFYQVKYLRSLYPDVNIQVDGGVGPDNIQACAEVLLS